MWRAWGRLALICCGLLASLPAQAQVFRPAGPYTHVPSGLVLPESLGGMARYSAHDYEPAHPGLGMSFKYLAASSAAFADVYVFNERLPSIADGTGDPLVERMLERAVGEIRSMEKAGHYVGVVPLGREDVALDARPGAPHMLLASFTYVMPSGPVFSNVYGMGARNHFVKVRFTYRKDQADEAQGLLVSFLQDLGAVVGQAH